MRKFLILLMLMASLGATAQLQYISDRAVAVNPFNGGMVPLGYAQVRVCTVASGLPAPCPSLAQIYDLNGNPYPTSLGSNFGQLTTDVLGRFNFACTAGNYNIQVQASGNNTPSINEVLTCPGNSSVLNVNNTWTGVNTFTEPIVGSLTGDVNSSGTSTFNILNATTLTATTANATTANLTNASIQRLNNVRQCAQFPGATADAQIRAAIADLPANGGIVDCRGYGATTQTWAATVQIGAAPQMVTLILDRATSFNVTITNGTAAMQLGPTSAIIGLGAANTNNNNGGFFAQSTTNVSNFLKLTGQGVGAGFYIEGLMFYGNPTAVVSDSVINLTNALQLGAVRNTTIYSFYNTVGLKITQTAGGAVGPLNIENLVADCAGNAGCRPVLVQAVPSGGVMLGINFFGGTITHPGPGGLAMVDLEGITGSDCSGVNFYGTQFESWNLTDIGIKINNCSGVLINAASFTAHINIGADAIQLNGGGTDGVSILQANNFNAWTNTIRNNINGKTIPAAVNQRVDYYFHISAPQSTVFDDQVVFNQSINNDGGGLKHIRVAGCTTAASVGATCTTTVTWTTAFPNANYTVNCGGVNVTGVPVNGGITSQTASAVTFQTVAATAAAAAYGTIECTAVHD